MPSIINGLFAARSGIASHGTAIAVIGDNISNGSTTGYKASRAEFQDLIAGGQAAGKVVGSGSSIAAVSTINDQGTLEFTGRPLDLAVDGNGLFVVADANGQKFYTRAGNFKVDTSGNIINQNGLKVLGYPAGGSGALEDINVNVTSQANIATNAVVVAGNVNASSLPIVPIATVNALAVPLASSGSALATPTFNDINSLAAFSTVVDVFDTLGGTHTVSMFFFHTSATAPQYTMRAYVKSDDVTGGVAGGLPRQITQTAGTAVSGQVSMSFANDGTRTGAVSPDVTFQIPWVNGSDTTKSVTLDLGGFTQYSAPATVKSISQDGQGIGNVASVIIEKNGDIFAKLSNGQTATIGTLGLANFSNPEGLTRVGNSLLQQSPNSGEPLIGFAESGTFGSISSGSLELSTVDIASEFVKLITLQRGFQSNSRIITTINQLLNDIIQLV